MLPVTALLLAACTTVPDADATPREIEASGEGLCDASSAQALVGTRATAEIGADILARTGARKLRWIPPRSVVTMDYREDRINVEYDDDLVITTIRCG